MTLKATSYEVDDSGNPLSAVVGKTTSTDITVVVKSVTDDISLKFDNKNKPDDTISSDEKTYTIASKLEEGNNVIDLKSILTPTSGNSVDLDGSEQRSYTVSGVPAGTIITLGGVSAVANSSGIATVEFDAAAEKIVDPTFTMTLPGQFSGKIDATITLKVTDIDDHTGSAVPETKTQTVYLKMNVDPIADQVTLSVSQAKGYEDAGRSKGNTSNDENADDINAIIKYDCIGVGASAGSTFKRPEGYFAGKLIMDSGLRGYRVGGAQVSEKHCGFVINTGDATAEDVRSLMKHVTEIVYAKFGVTLEPEVKFLGEF